MHCENLKQIEEGIKIIQVDLRRYISTENKKNEEIYTRLFSYLTTCWTEVRISKLAHEPSVFSTEEIEDVLSASTLKDKWITALNYSVCKANNINLTNNKLEIQKKLSFTPKIMYLELINLIEDDLLNSIEIRNKIAHGQWTYAFTSDLKSFSKKSTGMIRKENIVTLQLKVKLFKSLAQVIHDLAVSPSTFERNFDIHYKVIEQQRNNLHKRSYKSYRNKMINKYRRGIVKRRSMKTTSL